MGNHSVVILVILGLASLPPQAFMSEIGTGPTSPLTTNTRKVEDHKLQHGQKGVPVQDASITAAVGAVGKLALAKRVAVAAPALSRKPYALGANRRSLLSLFFGGELDTPLPNPQPVMPVSPYQYSLPYYSMPAMPMPMPMSPLGSEDGVGGSGTGLPLAPGDPASYDYNQLTQLPLSYLQQGQSPDAMSQFYPGPSPRPWSYSYSPYPYTYLGAGGSVNPGFGGYSTGIQFNPEVFSAILEFAQMLLQQFASQPQPPPYDSYEYGVDGEGEAMYDENYGYSYGYETYEDPGFGEDFQDMDASMYVGEMEDGNGDSYYSNELYRLL